MALKRTQKPGYTKTQQRKEAAARTRAQLRMARLARARQKFLDPDSGARKEPKAYQPNGERERTRRVVQQRGS